MLCISPFLKTIKIILINNFTKKTLVKNITYLYIFFFKKNINIKTKK